MERISDFVRVLNANRDLICVVLLCVVVVLRIVTRRKSRPGCTFFLFFYKNFFYPTYMVNGDNKRKVDSECRAFNDEWEYLFSNYNARQSALFAL
jgi:hypothetical protein